MSDDLLTTPAGVYERRDEVQIVDVREPVEWEAGRIEGAVHIPLNELMAGAGSDLDHDRPVVLVCRVGNRSELATMMLQARGYEAHGRRWAMDPEPGTQPRAVGRRRMIALVGYAVIVGALLAWQAVGLVRPGDDWPSLSELLRKVTRTDPGRWILFSLWLWLGWHLFVRGWRFFLRG